MTIENDRYADFLDRLRSLVAEFDDCNYVVGVAYVNHSKSPLRKPTMPGYGTGEVLTTTRGQYNPVGMHAALGVLAGKAIEAGRGHARSVMDQDGKLGSYLAGVFYGFMQRTADLTVDE